MYSKRMETDPRSPLDKQECSHSRGYQNDADDEEGDDALYGYVGQPLQRECLRDCLLPQNRKFP